MKELLETIPKSLLRVVTGLLYMEHGVQKFFGWPPDEYHPHGVPLISFLGLAGSLELFGGFLFAIGLFTRSIAFLLCGQMAVAYWLVHFALSVSQPSGWMPVVNKGELAILYCFIFLFFMNDGAGAWSLDAKWRGRWTCIFILPIR